MSSEIFGKGIKVPKRNIYFPDFFDPTSGGSAPLRRWGFRPPATDSGGGSGGGSAGGSAPLRRIDGGGGGGGSAPCQFHVHNISSFIYNLLVLVFALVFVFMLRLFCCI